MPRGKRTKQEYQTALQSAIFGGYEAEVFADVWDELADRREFCKRLDAYLDHILRDLQPAVSSLHDDARILKDALAKMG